MPNIYITQDDLPDVANWEDGKEYTIQVKQKSSDQDGVELEIISAEPADTEAPAEDQQEPIGDMGGGM
jgi:hypothetical protein